MAEAGDQPEILYQRVEIMDQEQFAQYLQQQAVAEEQARRDRAQQAQRTAQREEIKKLIKRVRVCDGSTPHLVREWVEDVEMCLPYVNGDEASLKKIVEETIQGPLRRAYERFMSGQADRQAVTWAAIRTHVRAAFLTMDEDEYLRSQIEKVHQTAYETNVAYGRRFQESADRAYPVAGRVPAEERVLLTAYIKGFRNKEIVRRLVQETRPETLANALTAVETFTADEERFKRYGWLPRAEEPMEVGAVDDTSRLKDTLDLLTRRVAGLQTSFGDMAAGIVNRKDRTTEAEVASVGGGDSLSQSVKKLEKSVECIQKSFTQLAGEMRRMKTSERPQDRTPRERPQKKPAARPTDGPTRSAATGGRVTPGRDAKTGRTICFYCKKPGHFKRDCFKLKRETEAMECSDLN